MTDKALGSGTIEAPKAYPAPGSYGVNQLLTLVSDTPGATIHYTMDGSAPSAASPVFDPYVLPVLDAKSDGDRGLTTHYTCKAIAIRGNDTSPVAEFDYSLGRRDRDVYLEHEVHPGLIQIIDFDDTKMMLILGSERALLIDTGLGNGDLRSVVEARLGGRPLDVVIAHGHPDHIVATAQFQGDYPVWMNHRDLPMVEGFNTQMNLGIDLAGIKQLEEGHVFDLGDRRLEVYEVPGHAPGHLALYDPATGILFASDAVGSNRAFITDSLWMQFPGMAPIDHYLSSLRQFRARISGPITEIYGGHNDLVVRGEFYLDNLERAAQLLVDRGPGILVPSLRPTTAWQVVVGDRLSDANWAAINVNRDTCLSVPYEQMASLSLLQLAGADLSPRFHPDVLAYSAAITGAEAAITATTMSTRHAGLSVGGRAAGSGVTQTLALQPGETRVEIAVLAPDGATRRTYLLTVTRG